VILASRVEAAPANILAARGPVRLDGGTPHLGALALPLGSAKPGQWVHVAGSYIDGQPHADKVEADRFCPNLYRCFPGPVDHIVLEAFLRSEGSKLRIDGLLLPARDGASHAGLNGIGVVSLERQADGSYVAVKAHAVDRGPAGAGNAAANSDTPTQDATRPSRPETISDRASRGNSWDTVPTIAGLSKPTEPSRSGFDRTGSSASLAASIPTPIVAPATLPAVAGLATPLTNQETPQDPLISESSPDEASPRRAVPMSNATPAHGRTTLITGSANQITTKKPGTDGAGTSPVGTSSGGASTGDATGGAHAGAATLP
jgi:hypothetical protein